MITNTNVAEFLNQIGLIVEVDSDPNNEEDLILFVRKEGKIVAWQSTADPENKWNDFDTNPIRVAEHR